MTSKKQLMRLNLSLGKEPVPEYNLVLLGSLGVGKSALTVKYITRRFIMEYDPVMEDTYTKEETVDGQDVILRIMDTYDKEDTSPSRYLKWAHGYIVVYSITNRQTFDAAKEFLESITFHQQREGGKEVPIVLVGNKVDLERYRTVSKELAQELADKFECMFYETSAADDFSSVETVFHSITREIIKNRDNGIPLQPLYISEDKSGMLNPNAGAPRIRRAKSPQTLGESKDKKPDKDMNSKLLPKPSRTPSTFKIFNKSFKIFN